MKIIELQLVKYKRMMLNNIDTFSIRPAQMIQLILGTNGSGKSSLIKELTPLPPDASDYLKEGSKTIKITNRGNSYLLKSVFQPSQKHSFQENGEELNPGGTVTVQKDLVWKYFGVNADVHELLTGLEVFHAMSPSRRREWFTKLSDINYDYAIEVFGRLRERSRDITGALKLAKKHLVTESTKIVSAAEETKLRRDVELTLAELNLLIEQSAPLERPVEDYRQEQSQRYDELTRLSTKLLRMRIVAPYGTDPYGHHPRKSIERDEWGEPLTPTFNSIEDIDRLLDQLRHEITAKETLINRAVSEHTTIAETVRVLTRTGAEGVTSLQTKLAALRKQKAGILLQRKLAIEGVDAANSLSAMESVTEVLESVFSAIPENKDKRFSGANMLKFQEQLLAVKDRKLQLNNQLARGVAQKKQMEAHKANGQLTCPKCHYQWVEGYSDNQYESVMDEIATKEAELDECDKEIAVIEAEMALIREYGEYYRDYIRCVRNWPILEPFWNYLIEGEYLTNAPRRALALLGIFRSDLELELAANEVEIEIKNTLDYIFSAEQVGDANLADQRLKLEERSHAIDQMTTELTALRIQVSEYSQYKRQLNEALELSAKISGMLELAEQNTLETIEMMRRETLNHCVRQLQHSLAIKQETLSAVELKKGIIADLESQIARLTVEEEASKILVKQLSPTDGLIAEGLLGFIRNYVGQMNALIRKIWSYPLQVMDCGVSGSSGAELDYKFPMLVQTKTNIVPDVKLGSSGMKEIVNLAFKVVAMRYLGLAESPLYLDEFGKALDKEHRTAATMTIKSLMDVQPFTQLFMISHYEEGYGSFTNSDICVLDPRNITVPGEYNKHVSIA